MESAVICPEKDIREIEDIINIQKANGNLNGRQVAFSVGPPDGERELEARSLESGVKARGAGGAGGGGGRKRRRAERRGCSPAAADGVSWPSDSDITVLRVAASGARAAAGQGWGGRSAGDGSSMVNLATLVQPSQPASKHSLLLPLSGWAGAGLQPPPPEPRRARLARFLRLYFCPCCSCLYEMERRHPRCARDAPSAYYTAPSAYYTAPCPYDTAQ